MYFALPLASLPTHAAAAATLKLPADLMHHLPLLVSGSSALVGLIVAVFGVRAYQRARASVAWPFAEGRVIQSEVVPGSEGTTQPKIAYEYTVNGQPYQGDRLKAAHKNYGTSGSHARTCVERYPVGARVQVFYNPAEPRESALEPGLSVGAYITLGIGLLLLLSAVIQYVVMTRVVHFR